MLINSTRRDLKVVETSSALRTVFKFKKFTNMSNKVRRIMKEEIVDQGKSIVKVIKEKSLYFSTISAKDLGLAYNR